MERDEHRQEPQEPIEIRTFYPESDRPAHGPRQEPVRNDPPPPRIRSRRRLAGFLFVTTCVSTFLVGMTPGSGPVGLDELVRGIAAGRSDIVAELVFNGFVFAGSLILILFAHEMGHYLQARRYGIPASLPYFIPFPISPFGTMGAVIVQGAGAADRKSMFDIAISGPLAGLVFALPITYLGVMMADVRPAPAHVPEGITYGVPLLLEWMLEYEHGALGGNRVVDIGNPLLFAGWVGIFITALNLIPIGQLDGGHILYTLIGRRAHAVAVLLLAGAVGYMVYSRYYAYGLMVVLLLMMGPKHPPTANDHVPLGWARILLGWLTLAFIVIGFTPMPIR